MHKLSDLNIGYEASDEGVGALIARYEEGDLVIDVDCQRGDVWDSKRASKLVESVMMGLPLPLFYTFEMAEFSEIIDGKQRFLSLLKYLNNEYKLTGLKVLKRLNGKLFSDLDQADQRIIKNHKLHVYSIRAETEEAKYEIFERLNTSGTQLRRQEIIIGLNEGSVSKFAKEMAERLIQEGVEKQNSNKHKQIEANVLQMMFFTEKTPDDNATKNNRKVWHDVLTNPIFISKLTPEYEEEAFKLLKATKESAMNVNASRRDEREYTTQNNSIREVLMMVFSKVGYLLNSMDETSWAKIAEKIEAKLADRLRDENIEHAFRFSTSSYQSRRIKTMLANELHEVMDAHI
ncbi:DUF262 domain-containing protein [Vibrio coralliirubri]|uniref:DUF262 domain-containing protein n=1 Tax=Vibrio coralliirubri TaxID=1516159 RepID=UPI002284408D|nr:DUF262 domain-containing protein [Vibrio coralliirubri]MCY9861103.1 DUF262 domain-containing protein [Vibrio coralliirubri]